jgi:hypothetical protein
MIDMRKYLWATVFTPLLLMMACQAPPEIIIATPEPKLVVYAYWSTGKNMKVSVLRSSGPQEEVSDEVNNALVRVFEDGSLIDTLQYEGNGLYSGPSSPSTGRSYQLEVQAAGFQTVTSTLEYMPDSPNIESVTTFDITEGENDMIRRTFALFEVTLWDTLSDNLFFTLSAEYIDVSGSRLKSYWHSPDLICDGVNSYSLNGVFGSDLSCWPSLKRISYETTNIEVGVYTESRQGITLCRVNEMDYRFNAGIRDTDVNDDGLFSSLIELPSNIEGGYGLFSLKSCTYFIVRY